MTVEDPDESIRRLRHEGAPDAVVGDAAMRRLEELLDLGHIHLGALHADESGRCWDDARKLDVLARLQDQGNGIHAVMLCHRWRLSATCQKLKPSLYYALFPPLPPRHDKGAKP